MDMKKYIMTLTPASNFCFGKESIRVNRLKEKSADSFFYFSESMMMPQQTALLGMLRYALLSVADKTVFDNNQIQNPAKAGELIGQQSFTKGRNNGFGKIKSIGACGLQIQYQGNTKWHPLRFAPMDYKLTVGKSTNGNGCKTLLNTAEETGIVIDGYKAKDGLHNELLLAIGTDGKITKEYKCSDIFKEVVQVGINRNIKTGHVENNSYYKQQFFRFADKVGNEKVKIQFCFNAELDASADISQLRGLSVQLGSDDSRFILNWQEIADDHAGVLPVYEESASSALPKLTLMSDSYLTPKEVALSIFNISDIKPFRSLSTTVNTEDYYNYKGSVQKSERSYLYVRGSVFFFDSEDKKTEFEDSLNKHKEFQTVGYNQYNQNKKENNNNNK